MHSFLPFHSLTPKCFQVGTDASPSLHSLLFLAVYSPRVTTCYMLYYFYYSIYDNPPKRSLPLRLVHLQGMESALVLKVWAKVAL